jgi:predicted nucleotidyltransferase
MKDMERAMLARLRRLDAAYFAGLPDVSEGLEHKLVAAVRDGCSLEEIIDAVKSKRYARSRICRILMRAYLDLTRPAGAPEYIRVLGFRRSSSELLRLIRERASLPIVQHTAADGKGMETLREEVVANDVWSAFAKSVKPAGSDYREFPVMIE